MIFREAVLDAKTVEHDERWSETIDTAAKVSQQEGKLASGEVMSVLLAKHGDVLEVVAAQSRLPHEDKAAVTLETVQEAKDDNIDADADVDTAAITTDTDDGNAVEENRECCMMVPL